MLRGLSKLQGVEIDDLICSEGNKLVISLSSGKMQTFLSWGAFSFTGIAQYTLISLGAQAGVPRDENAIKWEIFIYVKGCHMNL